MTAYKKRRRKGDPVKQILARLEEKQSKSGLSLYSRSEFHESSKDSGLPVVQPFNEATSTASKSTPFFSDVSAARQKAHRRLNEGLKQAIVEGDRKSAVYAKAKAEGRLNLTFPPVNSHEMAAPVNHRRQSYTFSGWSDNPSAGVENLRNNHYTSMNPFGYNRRTLAFQPTSVNYVVEWPETWPLKIMSLGKGNRGPYKKKEKVKPKVFRQVHFEGSPAPCTSLDSLATRNAKQVSSELVAGPPDNQSEQVLSEMQSAPLLAGTTHSQSLASDEARGDIQVEELPLKDEDLWENVAGNLLEGQDRNGAENQRVISDMSSLSEGVYVGTLNGETDEGPGEAESHQAGNTTKVSSVPPCTPTPTSSTDDVPGDTKDSEECEGGVAEEESRSLLMDIVSQIAAENGTDYLQDI